MTRTKHWTRSQRLWAVVFWLWRVACLREYTHRQARAVFVGERSDVMWCRILILIHLLIYAPRVIVIDRYEQLIPDSRCL